MIIVVYIVGLVTYWLIGVVVLGLGDRLLHATSRAHNMVNPDDDEDVGWMSFLALFWPVAILVGIALLSMQVARRILRKLQGN